MSFNDDEEIVIEAAQTAAKERREAKITSSTFNKEEAGLDECPFTVLVRLIAGGTSSARPGLDLIAVLDISGSMAGQDKIETMKSATSFVIKKLGQLDRLSVVTFSSQSTRRCPLRKMTDNAKQEIDDMVKALNAQGCTDIAAGLTTALEILDGRRFKSDRKPAIFLMSDGCQTDGDVTKIRLPSDVAVHTFGFGADYDSEVMNSVANRSMGGMFWQASVDKLTEAFAQCLAGLLTVAAEELELVLIPQNGCIIENVSAGSYSTTTNADGSVSVDFGDLYANEIRNTTVDLLLPKVEKNIAKFHILKHTYKTKYLKSGAVPRVVTIKRWRNARAEESDEVKAEKIRLDTVRSMKDASEMAEKNELSSAQGKVKERINKLDDEIANARRNAIKNWYQLLKADMDQFLSMIQTLNDYFRKGRAFVLVTLTSHNRQRFATRGDNDDNRLFATSRMNEYLEQATDFVNHPEKTVPTAEEDIKKEAEKDPRASFLRALTEYICKCYGRCGGWFCSCGSKLICFNDVKKK